MALEVHDLPDDILALKALIIAKDAELQSKDLQIEKLRATLARLKKLQFGHSSEKLQAAIGQLELALEDLETNAAAALPVHRQTDVLKGKPSRKPLPETLPRETVVHQPEPICPDCGGTMRRLGEDVTEVLEVVPARFKVVRHVRPKLSCRACERIVQAALPSLPIERGRPGPGLRLMCLCPNTAITCRSIVSPRSTRAKASSSLVRRLPIGSARRHRCLRRWSKRLGIM